MCSVFIVIFSIKKLPAPYQNTSLLPAVLGNCLATIALPIFQPRQSKDAVHAFSTFVLQRRTPKDVIVGLHTLKVATLDAVLSLNDGSISRASVSKTFGLNPGRDNTIKRLKEVDYKQKYHASKATRQLTK